MLLSTRSQRDHPGRCLPGGPSGKVSSNESPYPPLAAVSEAMTAWNPALNRYPERHPERLTLALAAHHRVSPQEITVGTGSVAALQYLVQASVPAGAELVYGWRSYETYPRLARINAAHAVQVPLRQEYLDLGAMARAVTSRTAAIIVCNPNNPSGTLHSTASLDDFLRQVPRNVLVILDEAYWEFTGVPEDASGTRLYRNHPNVAVVRTFSKAFGLAGLRVGYVIARPELTALARLCAVPFGVSAGAEDAALRALEHRSALRERVAGIVSERERMWKHLTGNGFHVPPSRSNFLWLTGLADQPGLVSACADAGITVRDFPGEGVRVTVATPGVNDLVCAIASRFAPADPDHRSAAGTTCRTRPRATAPLRRGHPT